MGSAAQYVLIFLKGMAMGAADIVPGVSGGTIAFISGIYDRLLGAINSLRFSVFRTLRTKGFTAAWKEIDATFLLALLGGMISSIILLSAPIKYALNYYPVLIWSFFFGLVLASIWLVGRQIKEYSLVNILLFIIGGIIALWITTLKTLQGSDDLMYIFFSGAIAICAMILPGVSGAFILLILGVYQIIINAIHERNLAILAIFGIGCIVGLLSFSRMLKWLLNNYRAATLAVLSGFLLGSLNKIWPWKNKLGEAAIYFHSDGREEWLLKPVLPQNFEGDAQLGLSFGLFTVGMLTIFVLSRFEKK
jgi:putative membrane protein